jgi:hypothetical protein
MEKLINYEEAEQIFINAGIYLLTHFHNINKGDLIEIIKESINEGES